MTGFSCYPGYLGVVAGGVCVGLVDHLRLLTYLRECALNPMQYRVRCGVCPEIGFDADTGDPRVICCPSTDPAPWFSSTDPIYVQDVASRFFGPEVIAWNPQPVGYSSNTSSPRVSHRPRRGKLRVEATIRLWGDGCDATLYGLEWFQRALECQECDGLQLRVLRACDPRFNPADPLNTGGNWWRDILGARILVAPVEPSDDRSDTCCFFRDVDVVIEADDSCEYWIAPSVECVMSAPWLGPTDEDDPLNPCRCAPGCPCPEAIPSCVGECLPDVPSARTLLDDFDIGCYCVPFSTCRKVCEIPSSATPGMSDGALVVEVNSVGGDTDNLRVWIWRATPAPGPDVEWDHWRCTPPCATIDVGHLRADDRLVVDGRDRTAKVFRQIETCDIEVTSMGGPMQWPILNCADRFWVAVEYDTYARADNLEVSVGVYPRECWSA